MPLAITPPWRDRRGRLIPIKAVVLALCCVPGLWIIGEWLTGNLGPRTLNAAILETGLWTVRFFLITLLVTPLRALFNWPRALLVRRAEARGLQLDDSVLDYLFRRVGRDLRTLTALLDRIDRASLAAQRRVTVPFLRGVLE